MTASLIFIEKDANFTEGGDMNSGPLGKICCLAVWDLKKVTPFFAGFFPTHSSKLTEQQDHLL